MLCFTVVTRMFFRCVRNAMLYQNSMFILDFCLFIELCTKDLLKFSIPAVGIENEVTSSPNFSKNFLDAGLIIGRVGSIASFS